MAASILEKFERKIRENNEADFATFCQFHLDEVGALGRESTEIIFAVGLAVGGSNHGWNVAVELARIARACQSPIEINMLAALAYVACGAAEGVFVTSDPKYDSGAFSELISGRLHDADYRSLAASENRICFDRITLRPQHQIGSYRADFLLEHLSAFPLRTADEPYAETFRVVIECDGHDFHERTKDQAARDRSRDREMMELGFPVLRYTGSEIWREPIKCAAQAVDFARGELFKQALQRNEHLLCDPRGQMMKRMGYT